MLDEEVQNDAAGTVDSPIVAVAGLLAEYALHSPQNVLSDIFMRLDAKEACKRRNALRVLNDMFEINRSILLDGEGKYSAYRKALAERLLERLYEKDINLRKQSAQLFAALGRFVRVSYIAREVNNIISRPASDHSEAFEVATS
jgi:hypothetical protein